MLRSRETARARWRVLAWAIAAVALPLALAGALFVVCVRSPSVIYLPGWIVVPPVTDDVILLRNGKIRFPSGAMQTSGGLHLRASGVRDGTMRLTNKRIFRLGPLTVVER